MGLVLYEFRESKWETIMPVLGAVVLAAGKSERMGINKFLLPWGNELAGGRILRILHLAGFSEIILVLGFDKDNIQSSLGSVIEMLGVKIVFNPHHEKGMLSSVKAGVRELREDIDGFFVVLGDQPFLKVEWLERLQGVFSPSDTLILTPVFRGEMGHPVLFNSRLREEILSLEDEKDTLRTLLARCSPLILRVDFSDEEILWDIDTPEELERRRI